jgi:integrase
VEWARDAPATCTFGLPETVEQTTAECWTDTNLIFTRKDGEALHPEVVSRFFRRTIKRAALPTIRLHDLRHTHAILALRADIHPKVVSERLGHATVAITLDTYSHAIPALQEEAAGGSRNWFWSPR